MSNNVRGPSSALTEFLRDAGITATTIARRAATRNREEQQQQQQQQPEAGPSRPANTNRRRRSTRASGYASDELDEPENAAAPEDAMQVDEAASPTKKRKLTKAAEAKLKAQEKKKLDKKDGGGEDEEEDAYTAPSRSLWATNAGPKPPVGSFEKCAICEKQFTVTKYTMASSSGSGFLCHQCAKAGGVDPFKKPAVPKKRKAPTEKRNITKFEEKRFPTLVNICIQLITKHINDIEVLGDIGVMNVEAISKALSKNRGLTQDNVHLFYNTANESLTLFDATNLPSPALETLAYHNRNLTSLRLDFCGHLDDAAFNVFSTSLGALERIELLGPFLIRPPAWKKFFTTHPNLEGFLVTQSPRFDIECVTTLVEHCPGIKDLRLKEIGKIDDAFLEQIQELGGLRHLDISDPSHSCSDEAMVSLLTAIGSGLTYLNVSKHRALTDAFLTDGLLSHMGNLAALTISYLPELTDAGVGAFFDEWAAANGPLNMLDASRNEALGDLALEGILKHSGHKLTQLNINGWKDISADALNTIGRLGIEMRKLDVGFCRAVDDFVVKMWLEGEKKRGVQTSGCRALEELKVWGCNRVTSACPRKKSVVIQGIESQASR